MKIKILVIAIVWLLSGFLLSAQAQSQACGCADKQDLLNLLNQTQMELQELQFQTDLILAQEKADGKPKKATTEIVNKLNGALDNAAKSVANKTYPGHSMNVVDCTVKRENTYSDCVELVKKRFYDVIQQACREDKDWRGSVQPYYEVLEVKSYLLQIFKAKQEMKNFILQMLSSLPKSCRPNNWFGYVVYQKVNTAVGVKTLPANNNTPLGTNGGTETQGGKNTYIGTVFVEEGKAVSARAYAAYSFDNSYKGTARVQCTSKEPIGTTQKTSGRTDILEGESDGTAEFSLNVNPAMRTYGLSAYFFPVTLTGQSKGYTAYTAAAGCPGGQNDFNSPAYLRADKQGHFVSDQKITSPDSLEGTDVVKPPLSNQSTKGGNTAVTETYEIQFRWMLRRLPAAK